MSRPSESTLREQILQHLETLTIPLSGEQLDELLSAAFKNKLTHPQLLERLLALAAGQRRERSVERRLRQARFRNPATFESFDWKFNEATIDRAQFLELGSGEFVRRRENLVMVGKSGVGKSHLVQGIGRRCCGLGYGVRFPTVRHPQAILGTAASPFTLNGTSSVASVAGDLGINWTSGLTPRACPFIRPLSTSGAASPSRRSISQTCNRETTPDPATPPAIRRSAKPRKWYALKPRSTGCPRFPSG